MSIAELAAQLERSAVTMSPDQVFTGLVEAGNVTLRLVNKDAKKLLKLATELRKSIK